MLNLLIKIGSLFFLFFDETYYVFAPCVLFLYKNFLHGFDGLIGARNTRPGQLPLCGKLEAFI